MQVEKPRCHEAVWRGPHEFEPCDKPAKFTVAYLFDTWPVCGIHARRYKNRYGATLTTLPTGRRGTMKEPLRLWMPDDKGEMQVTLLEDEHADQYVYLDDYRELESKLDAILAAIRHCAGESSFDSFNFKGGGYCSECGRGTKAGHDALCWRRFAFEETTR